MKRYTSMTDFAIPMIYVATPGAIDISGDRATARVYTSEIYRDPANGAEHRVRGRNDNELVRVEGRWLFARRCYRTIHIDTS